MQPEPDAIPFIPMKLFAEKSHFQICPRHRGQFHEALTVKIVMAIITTTAMTLLPPLVAKNPLSNIVLYPT
jgi:hypothetical protein